jgi:hypothetical protein
VVVGDVVSAGCWGWQFEPIWCDIRHPIDTVSPEILVLSLLAIGDNGGARGLKLLDRVPNGFDIKRFQTLMPAAASSDCFKQFQRAWNTPDRLGRNDHGSIRDILRIRYRRSRITLPLLGDNTYKLHVGPNVSSKAFWSVPRDVVVWENLMNAKTLLLTANTETVYACVI